MMDKMRKNIAKGNFGQMVKFHCIKKSKVRKEYSFDPVNKNRLFNLYRAIMHRIVPKELFGGEKVSKQILKNIFVLVNSGKKYPVLLRHLMLYLDPAKVPWINR